MADYEKEEISSMLVRDMFKPEDRNEAGYQVQVMLDIVLSFRISIIF